MQKNNHSIPHSLFAYLFSGMALLLWNFSSCTSTPATGEVAVLPEPPLAPTLPDPVKTLLLHGALTSKGLKDPLIVNEESRIYYMGNPNSDQKIYLLEEGIGRSSHGHSISVLREQQGTFRTIQSFFGFPDSVSGEDTQVANLNLYYRALLFEGQNPVSVNYTWNGSHYQFNAINYVISSSDILYSGSLLRLLGIVSDEALSAEPPFLTNEKVQTEFTINEIAIDTICHYEDSQYLVLKNKYLSHGSANKIWVIEEKEDAWLLLAEYTNPEFATVEYRYPETGQCPEVYFGTVYVEYGTPARKADSLKP